MSLHYIRKRDQITEKIAQTSGAMQNTLYKETFEIYDILER
jgi:hypothetical protein